MWSRAGREKFAFLIVLFLSASTLLGDQPPLLPEQLAGWQRTDWSRVAPRELESVAGTEAPILREYGALTAERATYRRGPTRWQLTLFRMQDRTGAYGAHSLLRGFGSAVPLGEAGTRTSSRWAFYQGNYFLLAEPVADQAALAALARLLASLPEQVASLPVLASFLPQEGLQRGSEQYFLGPRGLAQAFAPAPGDWVGFAYGAEVQLARYRRDTPGASGDTILLLISYPTPQIARDRLEDFNRIFNLPHDDPARPPIFARRIGTLVALVSGIPSREAATRFLGSIRYELAVSWSDPSDPREATNWGHTLANLFIGTGVFLLFTLASALAYAFFRLAVKRLFPGVIFDRPSDQDLFIFRFDPPEVGSWKRRT